MARALSHSINGIPRSLFLSSACIGGGGVRLSFQNYHYIPSDSITFHPLSESSSSSSSLSPETARRIEDAIHGIIVKRSAPDWLPFVPGTSYWVPPRRSGCGIAQLLHRAHHIKLTAHDELMSVTSSRGWPSSAFFTEEASSDQTDEAEPPSNTAPSVDCDE